MKAFPLTHAGNLPLTGEFHPLRKESAKWLSWANGLSATLGILVFASWSIWPRANEEAAVPGTVSIIHIDNIPTPRPIQAPKATQLSLAEEDAAPRAAEIEPVPDPLAQQTTIPPTNGGDDPEVGGIFAVGDSIVIDEDRSPASDDFVLFDELPVLLSVTRPSYPELAREAGFDAVVKVRVLVGKDGRVKEAIVIEGPDLFREPCVAAAKAALFKPALRNGRPVEVWIDIPFAFSLQK